MTQSPYEPAYQESFEEVYKCVMGESLPKGGGRTVEGGKAIGAGGYGCVLRPAIRCKGEETSQQGYISKLLTIDAAKEEMSEIDDAFLVIKDIPNYEKYFAVTDYRMCIPANLTKEDKKDFKYMCEQPLGLTAKEFDKRKNNEVRAIISPDLGLDVRQSLKMLFSNSSEQNIRKYLAKFNLKAADFLENGLSQLQKHDYYHSDVKPENMMTKLNLKSVSESFDYIKLIDFGLALPINASASDVNDSMLMNFPFTAPLFRSDVTQSINRKINRSLVNGKFDNLAKQTLKKQLKDYASYLFLTIRTGHTSYIMEIGPTAYNMSKGEFIDYLLEIWSEYVLEAITTTLRVTKNNSTNHDEIRFAVQPYWENIYKYNLDVWGFLTTFLILASYANKNGHTKIARLYLKRIVKKYLYNQKYGGQKIPVNAICNELRNLSKELEPNYKKNARLTVKSRINKKRVSKKTRHNRAKRQKRNVTIKNKLARQ